MFPIFASINTNSKSGLPCVFCSIIRFHQSKLISITFPTPSIRNRNKKSIIFERLVTGALGAEVPTQQIKREHDIPLIHDVIWLNYDIPSKPRSDEPLSITPNNKYSVRITAWLEFLATGLRCEALSPVHADRLIIPSSLERMELFRNRPCCGRIRSKVLTVWTSSNFPAAVTERT